jgi:peptide/nickel transport system ATP-binding protein
MSAPLLEVRHLRTHFFTRAGVVKAVEGVSFALGRGEILGLVGESGSGKSVTGFSLIGLVDPPGRVVSGSIRFDRRELVGLPVAEMRRLRGKRIAMVFQDPAATLNPVLTVGAQMALAVRAHGNAGDRAARDLAARTLTRVGIPDAAARLDAYPHEFSGGMRQRVAIATALLHGPELIIADEPTTALDVSIQAQILAEMKALAKEAGTALIWISHDLATVSSLADRVLVMYAGRIVESGPVAAVLRAPLHPYTRGLLDSLPAMARPGEKLNQIPGSTPALLSLPPGCPLRAALRAVHGGVPHRSAGGGGAGADGAVPPPAAGGGGMSAILSAQNVTRRFSPRVTLGDRIAGALGAQVDRRAVQAVTDVSLEVRQGETLGLVGESGCGKSTLGRMLAGILPPSDGVVRLHDAPPMRGRHKTTTRIQTVFQDPFASLNPRMRIGETIAEGPVAHGLVTRAAAPAMVARWLARVGLDPGYATRFPHQFSGGQRQRVAIARALAMQPEVLVCDEPVASLDVSIQAQILNLFLELRQDLGLTCLFISHDPQRGAACQRPRGGDVSRPDRGDGRGRAGLFGAAASLHAGAARLGAEAAGRRERGGELPADQRRAALTALAAAGLRLPSALPQGDRAVPGGTAAAGAAGGWDAGGLPSRVTGFPPPQAGEGGGIRTPPCPRPSG